MLQKKDSLNMNKHGRGYENANCRLEYEKMRQLKVWKRNCRCGVVR
jgi:hypothetical protein